MKKFLQKKPVMISFIVAAVLFLAIYIGMLVRPVSYGFNYTNKETEGKETTITKINVKSNKVARVTNIEKEEGKDDEKSVLDYWVYVDGDRAIIVGYKEVIEEDEADEAYIETQLMSKEEYKKEAERLSKLSENEFDVSFETAKAMGMAYEFNIFEMETGTGSYAVTARNNQAIAFTVVHGVVTLVLMAFAGLSIFCVIKKK